MSLTLGESLKLAVAMKKRIFALPPQQPSGETAPKEDEPEDPPQIDEPTIDHPTPRQLKPRPHPTTTAVMGWPVHGRVTSGFGMRLHPILHVQKQHKGVDIAAPQGAAVRCVGPGRVVFAGTHGSHGLTVIIDHGGGSRTLYAHMSALSVAKGDDIAAETIIGAVGSTGLSTGAHLHFERLQDGVAVEPGLG